MLRSALEAQIEGRRCESNRLTWVAITSIALSLGTCVGKSQAIQKTSEEVRIQRVLNGLRPPIAIKGRPAVRLAITDQMIASHVPGISIAVVDGDRIVWTRALGVKEAGSSAPVTDTTLFEAQSISKAVTATATLVLVNSGRIALDQSPNAYLTSWKLPYNAFQAQHPVTIREVLSHSSGLNVSSFQGYRAGQEMPTLLQILDGEQPANNPPVRVDSVPGSAFRYSGGGAEVMQQLLSDVTGQSFPRLMKQLVLEPTGMISSAYEQPLSQDREELAASGHDGEGVVTQGRWPIQPELAAAGLWTTPADLAKWEIAIAKAWQGQDNPLFSKQIAMEMLTVQKAPYGLGVEVRGVGPALEFSHGGSNSGFRALAVMFPAAGKGAVIMANGDRADAVIGDLITSIASEYHWPARAQEERTVVSLTPGQMDAVTGIYSLPPGPSGAPVTYEVTREGQKLFAQIKGLASYPKGEIFPASALSFFNLGGIGTDFIVDNAGHVTGLRFGSIEGKRILQTQSSPSVSK